jgi:integrase
MSVHARGKGWQVKWRDLEGERHAQQFALKGDADDFDREIKRAKAFGPALYRELIESRKVGVLTLRKFVEDGFKPHLSAANRSRRTREQYQWALEHHLRELAGEALTALDVPRLIRHQQFLLEHGRTAHTTRTVMTLLGGILQVAVAHGLLPGNPVRAMPKAKADPKPKVRPLAPVEVEALIAASTGRDRVVAVLGGRLGLRPIEIRGVDWNGYDGEWLFVGPHQTKRTAVAAGTRTIRVDRESAHILNAWRLQSGGRGEDRIVGEWTAHAMKQWWRRFTLARKVTGRDDVTLYLLRHSHASALHYIDGMTVPAAAKRCGHGPALHLTHYAHVVDRLEGKPKYRDLDALVAAARAELADGWQPEAATG